MRNRGKRAGGKPKLPFSHYREAKRIGKKPEMNMLGERDSLARHELHPEIIFLIPFTTTPSPRNCLIRGERSRDQGMINVRSNAHECSLGRGEGRGRTELLKSHASKAKNDPI